ncbi:hypothetical protein ACWDV4_10670 [Micromonospora sp. NPDC003197]
MSADELNRSLDLLVRRVGHWEGTRWAGEAASGLGSRADVMYRLVQRIADFAADVEDQPRRQVPRLENSGALVDQLRVVVNDLIASGAPTSVLSAAAADIAAVSDEL